MQLIHRPRGRMRWVPHVGLLVLTSCSVIATTTPVSRDLGVSAVATTAAATTTTTATTSLTGHPVASLPMASDVLITPSGVVVAILEATATGYRVRTPCGDEVHLSAGRPAGPVEVVLDPGHGGEPDPGAVGSNGLRESVINLRVARAAAALLEARGIGVVLTRTADYSTTLTVRAQLADHAGADLMVSIHHNAPSAGPSAVPGTEIFVQRDSTASRRLGGLLYQHVTGSLAALEAEWVAAPDAGVLEVLLPRGVDAYGMLRAPETVTVLAELGYIANPSEAALFATARYVDVAASAVADAVAAYLETDDPGEGFAAEPRIFIPQPGIGTGSCVDPAFY